MTCQPIPGGVVCSSTAVKTERRIFRCPTCKRRTRHVCRLYEWYGWLVDCCACGDSWEDGFRLQRPARKGWREQAIADAKARWDAA